MREMVVLRMVVLTCVLHASLALVLQPRATVAGRARTLGQLCELRTARALGGPRGARVTARVVRPVMADASIQAQIKQRMKTAMKGGPDAKKELSAVRLMVAAMETRQKEENLESLSDEQAQAVLSKLAKMRKESIAMFEGGGKAEAAAAEQFELTILQEYLPTMADEATVRVWIGEAIAEACPDGADKKMMGKVMGALMKAHKGEFDGKAAPPLQPQRPAPVAPPAPVALPPAPSQRPPPVAPTWSTCSTSKMCWRSASKTPCRRI